MADRALLITWGAVVRGREERALENFNQALGLYGRMQQEGRLERFDITLLDLGAASAAAGGANTSGTRVRQALAGCRWWSR